MNATERQKNIIIQERYFWYLPNSPDWIIGMKIIIMLLLLLLNCACLNVIEK